MTLGKVSTIVGISATLITGLFWIFTYHQTLSTKEDVNLIYIELRLRDVEDAMFYYSQQEQLSEYAKIRFERTKKTMDRLESERDKILGLSK